MMKVYQNKNLDPEEFYYPNPNDMKSFKFFLKRRNLTFQEFVELCIEEALENPNFLKENKEPEDVKRVLDLVKRHDKKIHFNKVARYTKRSISSERLADILEYLTFTNKLKYDGTHFIYVNPLIAEKLPLGHNQM